MKSAIFFFLAFLLQMATGSEAQIKQYKKLNLNLSNACHYSYSNQIVNNQQVEVLEPNKSDMELFDKIISYTGLVNNYKIWITPNITSAAACLQGTNRVLLVNIDFINRMKSSNHSDWTKIGILAHELGHHLNNHSFSPSTPNERRRDMEIEADKFSGFLLRQMGADQNDVLMGINQLEEYTRNDNPYYPNPNIRRQAISSGWSAADALTTSDINRNSKKSDPTSTFIEILNFTGGAPSYLASDNRTYSTYEMEYLCNGKWTVSTDPNYLYEITSFCNRVFYVNKNREILGYWYEKVDAPPVLIKVGSMIAYKK